MNSTLAVTHGPLYLCAFEPKEVARLIQEHPDVWIEAEVSPGYSDAGTSVLVRAATVFAIYPGDAI